MVCGWIGSNMVECCARKGGEGIVHWEAWCSLIMSTYHAPYMARDWCYRMITNVPWYRDCINSGSQLKCNKNSQTQRIEIFCI